MLSILYSYVSYCRQLSAILLIVINKITDSYQQHYWQLSTISLFGRKPKPVSYIIYIRTVTIICFIHPFVYLYRQKQLNHTVSCFIYMKIKEYSMRLTYIYHSGFAIETEGYTILIDYFKDTGKTPDTGFVHDELLRRAGTLYILSSHFHPDHFNPDVLKWKEIKSDIKYIFSKDILKRHRATAEDAVYLKKGDVFEDENIRIRAFG